MTKVMRIITYPRIDLLDQQDTQQTLGPPRYVAYLDAWTVIILYSPHHFASVLPHRKGYLFWNALFSAYSW